MADDEMTEADDVKVPIRHGVISTDDFAQQDDVPNIEQQAAETLSLPEVSHNVIAAIQANQKLMLCINGQSIACHVHAVVLCWQKSDQDLQMFPMSSW